MCVAAGARFPKHFGTADGKTWPAVPSACFVNFQQRLRQTSTLNGKARISGAAIVLLERQNSLSRHRSQYNHVPALRVLLRERTLRLLETIPQDFKSLEPQCQEVILGSADRDSTAFGSLGGAVSQSSFCVAPGQVTFQHQVRGAHLSQSNATGSKKTNCPETAIGEK